MQTKTLLNPKIYLFPSNIDFTNKYKNFEAMLQTNDKGQSYKANFGTKHIKREFSKLNFTKNYIKLYNLHKVLSQHLGVSNARSSIFWYVF